MPIVTLSATTLQFPVPAPGALSEDTSIILKFTGAEPTSVSLAMTGMNPGAFVAELYRRILVAGRPEQETLIATTGTGGSSSGTLTVPLRNEPESYFFQIDFTAPKASPQSATAVLTVTWPGGSATVMLGVVETVAEPDGGYSGSGNYVLAKGSGCATLTDIKATISFTEDLVFESGPTGFGIQLNAETK